MIYAKITKRKNEFRILFEFYITSEGYDLIFEGNDIKELADQAKAILEEKIPSKKESVIINVGQSPDEKITIHFYPTIERKKSEIVDILQHFLDSCIVVQPH